MDLQHEFHLPDLAFLGYCQEAFQVNRGIYNTIDYWLYEQGVMNIVQRRKHIWGFLSYAYQTNNGSLKFGSGGLRLKLEEYWALEVSSRVVRVV